MAALDPSAVCRSPVRNLLKNIALFAESRCLGERETAGASTALRSGRDDNSVVTRKSLSKKYLIPCNRIVIPAGAKRSGGACGFPPNLSFGEPAPARMCYVPCMERLFSSAHSGRSGPHGLRSKRFDRCNGGRQPCTMSKPDFAWTGFNAPDCARKDLGIRLGFPTAKTG